jgi:OPA family sugar phosphate sensor protein UhpC-like MFS transporter
MTEEKRARLFRFQLFTATWLSYVGFYLCRKVFGVVKAPLKEWLQVDDLHLANIWTAYLVAYMLGQFLAVWMGKRLAARSILLLGMGVTIAANLAMGFVLPLGPAAYWWLLGFMVIQGLAQATGWPGNISLMANWTRHSERGTVMAWWSTCYQLGGMAGKALAAFVFGWLGLAWSFWGASLLFLAIWVLFLAWGRERPEEHGLPAIPDHEPRRSGDKAVASPRSALTEGQILGIIISMGAIYFSFKFLRYALDSWSALIIKEHFALSTSAAGYISAAFDIVGFLGVIVSGVLSDKIFGGGRSLIIFIMSSGTFIAALLLWRVGLSSPTAFAVLLGAVGFMMFGPDAMLSGTLAMDLGSEKTALKAAGIVNGLGSIGPIVQEPVIGYLKTYYGESSVLLLLVGMAALAMLGTGWFWYANRKRGLAL